jgi:radical SAM family uncharacterized protein
LDLWGRLEPVLGRVAKPSRYVDGEFGAVRRDAKPGDLKVCLSYPDAYEIGMSNMGLAILYSILTGRCDVVCERTYVPWPDMAAEMRAKGIPAFSLESFSPVAEFDILGISLQYELTYTNVLELLDLAGVPLRSADRTEGHPIVLAGGPCVVNPQPMSPFIDAFLIGEAEEAIVEIAEALGPLKHSGAGRAAMLEALAGLEGVYVPALYEERHPSGGGTEVVPRAGSGAPPRVRRRVVRDLDLAPVPERLPVPFVDVVHDRCSIEIMRGCTRGCRFCQASTLYRPVRERSRRTVARAAQEQLASTGYEELSLTSLSSTDHSDIERLLIDLRGFTEPRAVATSLPSLRVDAFSVELAELVSRVKKTGLTFAPEAGTQRLRDVINKNVTEEQLMDTTRRAFEAGWRRFKLYFMIGLPTETDDDVLAIGDLVGRVLATAREAAGRERRGSVSISVTVSTFVPKALTPFQWEGQLSDEEVARRQTLLRSRMPRKNVQLSWHDPATSRLEGLVARGDARIAPLVEAAWRAGARFDAWTEEFKPEVWWREAEALGIDVSAAVETPRDPDAPLPWDHLDYGLDPDYLLREREAGLAGRTTPDCRWDDCALCGVCETFGMENVLSAGKAGARVAAPGRGAPGTGDATPSGGEG